MPWYSTVYIELTDDDDETRLADDTGLVILTDDTGTDDTQTNTWIPEDAVT